MSRAEVLQSMRTREFDEFVVRGCQYQNEGGERHWYVALTSSQAQGTRIYHVRAGERPDGLNGDVLKAVMEAIHSWEYEPSSRPN